jgi:phosphomannomutase
MRHPRPVPALFGPLISPREELADELSGPQGREPQRPVADARGADIDPRPETLRTYICPGEKHAIPRSIHLARLAAFYPNCRTCEHRHDTGQLPRSMIGRLEETARRFQQETPFRMDGVRGAYLNQLSRSDAAQFASAVAQRLWSARPLNGRVPADSEPPPARRTAGPAVVIGQDSRPSSADLCVGVSAALKRMGCDVIDIGRVSRPCLVFAVEHLQTAAGLYVTGSGCPASWTGLDIIGEGGIPWSMNGTLADIERRMQATVSRPTRQGGAHRFFDAAVPYRASLLKFYQQVPAVRILGCCAEPTVLETLAAIFETLPCELIPGEVPMSSPGDESNSPSEPNLLPPAIVQEMQRTASDWAGVIDESGSGVRLFGRNGQLLAIARLLRDHMHVLGFGGAASPIAVGPEVDAESRQALRELGRPLVDVEQGAEAMARSMQQVGAAMGVQAGGRLWFSDPAPRCDAAVTLGRVLQTISAVR